MPVDQVIVFIFGLVFGSFFNVCIYRIPNAMSISFPPSHCPNCDHRLGPSDLVPVVSYLFLRGRCRYCGEPISARYPVVEVLTGLVFVLVYRRFGLSFDTLVYVTLASLLIIISYIDIDHEIIPDRLVIFGLAAGVIFQLAFAPRPHLDALLGFFAGSVFLLVLALVSNGGMGGGDIKLAAVLGLFLGWKMVLLALFVAFFIGAVVGVTQIIVSRRRLRGATIPFGPFIAMGAFIVAMWGQEIIDWYMGRMLW